MSRKILLAVLILSSVAIYGSSETGFLPDPKPGTVEGVIIDSLDGIPLQYANITLHNSVDSSFAAGSATGIKGEFLFPNLPEGNYYLKISYMGYVSKFIPNITISQSKSKVNLGEVKLLKNAVELGEAKVSGEKPVEEFQLDKKVINVSADINSAGGTVLDVLRNQPSVRVDADGNVYLRGSSNFTILVNGRPYVLQGSDALRQIAANSVENIEIITNPSAKYDAESAAGIININLKKQTEYSLSGIANGSVGSRDKYNSDFSGNYSINGLNITAGADFRINNYFSNQEMDRNTVVPSGLLNNLTKIDRRDRRDQTNARFGIDYTIDPQNSLSINASFGNIELERDYNSKVHQVEPGLEKYAYIKNRMDLSAKFFTSSLYYTHKFEPDVNDIIFEFFYTKVDMPNVQKTDEHSTDNTFSTTLTPLMSEFKNGTNRDEGRIKVNYSHKFDPTSSLEIGVQSNFSYRYLDIEYKTFNWNNPIWVIDNNLTNNFNFRNNVYAGFVTYSNEFLGFSFQAGLRGEYLDRLLNQNTLNSSYRYDKMDLFPSLSISRKIEDHQLQFSYSRRVDRPHESLLNPYPFYSDSYLTTYGNPQLLPEYINSYELNYQKMFGNIFTSVQTYLRNSENAVLQVHTVDNNGKLYATFGNFAKTLSAGVELSSSLPLLQWLRIDPGVNLFHYELDGDLSGRKVETKTFSWTARLNTTLTVMEDTRLQVSANYYGKQIDAQAEFHPVFFLNMSLRKDFFERRFSVTLQAQNILTTSYWNVMASGQNYLNYISGKQEVPVINLLFSYNFNNFKRSTRGNDNVDVNTGF